MDMEVARSLNEFFDVHSEEEVQGDERCSYTEWKMKKGFQGHIVPSYNLFT